ncbi:MAG: hypothetical protein IT170_18645 [Bryobacterales bacterium]|nr:hypothetical protein [Bryobacterales bacterium]
MMIVSIVVVLTASLALASLCAFLLLKALFHAIRPGNPSSSRTQIQ